MRLSTAFVIQREWEKLKARAEELGHELTAPAMDTEVSVVAYCTGCDGIFAVDGQERPYQFGAALGVVCEVAA